MLSLEEIVNEARLSRCSDVHLSQGEPLSFRIDGVLLRQKQFGPIDAALILSPLLEGQRHLVESGQDLDFALSLAGGRQRANIYRQSGRLAMTLRLLRDKIPTLKELRLPPTLAELTNEPYGLVLVTGPAGCGKSTTLAAMIDHINHTRRCHIITIEDPLEYIHHSDQALVHQREIGTDAPGFVPALRSALREDPDVILLGEMRDFETISAALTAAETGHLVLSTLHTSGAARTVDRIIDVFPAEAQNQVRVRLASLLRGVITQKLLPLAGGEGRVATTEVMVASDAVNNLIREGKTYQLPAVIHSGAALGMHSMEADLAALVRAGKITPQVALANAPDAAELQRLLQRA
jgi:twitching motility protein PilT